ncbi:MAG TPA: sigma-54 dependent transcriptional regulator [Armatimonadota bacterium]|nr:sigma-54 dependent transcriptional regulator [Armatimonadota bacterium]
MGEPGDTVRVLVVDDEQHIRRVLEALFRRDGYEVYTAETPQRALALAAETDIDVLVADLIMPDLTGVQLMQEIRQLHPGVATVMITAHGSVRSAVDAMKLGAFDYIAKPFDMDELLRVVRKAIDWKRLNGEAKCARELPDAKWTLDNIVGSSPQMQQVCRIVRRAANSRATVLLRGESGTGKELVALALHKNSPRARHPFVPVAAAALSEELLESELFGHEKGSFTGATNQRIGRFELADGGTLFLDEIGDISPALQVKLLRVLQEREFERVGGTKTIKVDVRLIAATNRDLEAAVAAGRFRHDLYYRLQVIQITMPPLRQRKEDLPALVDHFIRKYAGEDGRQIQGVSDEAMEILTRHSWPGNVRELENCIEYAVVMSEPDATLITPDVLPLSVRGLVASGDTIQVPAGTTFDEAVAVVERELLLDALKKTGWNLRAASAHLGMSDRSLEHYIRKHGLESQEDWMPKVPPAIRRG